MTPRDAAGWTVVAALAAAALSAPAAETDNSVDGLLGANTPEARAYRAFRDAFAADDITLVTLDGGTVESLVHHIQAVHAEMESAPEIRRVVTASTAFGSALAALADPELGGLAALPGVKAALDGPLNRELRLFDAEARHARLVGTSAPGRPPRTLFAALESARTAAAEDGVELRVAGSAVLNAAIDRAGAQIEARALPAVVAIAGGLLLFALRRLRITAFMLVCVAVVVFGAGATLGALGGTSNVLVVVHRPIAFVLVLASGFHLVEAWRTGADSPAAAARARAPAIALALGTTAVGFGSLAASDLPPIRSFGLLTAACLFAAIPVVLLGLPALLRGARPPPARSSWSAPLALALARWGMSHPKLAIGAAAVVLGLGGLSASNLPIDSNAVHYFGPEDPVRRDHEAIEASGLGLQSLEVLLDFGAPWTPTPNAVRSLDRFARAVRGLEGVTTRMDPALLLLEAGHRVAGRAVPPDPLTLERVWAPSTPERRATVGPDGHIVRAAFLIETVDAAALDRLESQIRALAAEQLSLSSDQVSVTGSYRVLLEAQRSLLRTLVTSLFVTALVMQLVLTLALRSLRTGIAAMIPNLLPVAAIFIVMRALDIPLNLGTCMVASLSLGIAVDDTLHFCLAHRELDLESTARQTGRAILLTSLIMSFGFSALIPSTFRPTAAFGLLTAVALMTAVAADLIVLPPLLALAERGRTGGADRVA